MRHTLRFGEPRDHLVVRVRVQDEDEAALEPLQQYQRDHDRDAQRQGEERGVEGDGQAGRDAADPGLDLLDLLRRLQKAREPRDRRADADHRADEAHQGDRPDRHAWHGVRCVERGLGLRGVVVGGGGRGGARAGGQVRLDHSRAAQPGRSAHALPPFTEPDESRSIPPLGRSDPRPAGHRGELPVRDPCAPRATREHDERGPREEQRGVLHPATLQQERVQVPGTNHLHHEVGRGRERGAAGNRERQGQVAAIRAADVHLRLRRSLLDGGGGGGGRGEDGVVDHVSGGWGQGFERQVARLSP